MIYMVECAFGGEPASEREWNAWYANHMRRLLSVPGLASAQRFQSTGSVSTYCALYTIESPRVFDSAAYAGIKGGNFPPEWRASITGWRRTVYDGLDQAPVVERGQVLLLVDDGATTADQPALAVHWLTAVALDRDVTPLGVSVAEPDDGRRGIAAMPKARAFVPITGYLRPTAQDERGEQR